MPPWSRYYAATEGRPPRQTLLAALDALEAEGPPGLAIDLGCGAGRDTVEMLRRGWRVIAIDAEPEALERLAARPDLVGAERLETRLASFADPDFALPACDLVNASFSIPFVAPQRFYALWADIGRALRPGGIFAGQLLGPRDTWAANDGVTSLDAAALDALLAGWTVGLRDETEEDATTVRGTPKHWHLHHLVLRKPREDAP
jgi:SAM-dependent methyltransferase